MMNSHSSIRSVSTRETLPLRQKILKPFLTLEECINPGDDDESTHHFGLFLGDELISVATFIAEEHPHLSAASTYRLRGMATASKFAGQGFGSQLFQYGESYLIQNKVDLIWFNARIKAFPFYERLGYLYWGDLFELDRIGPHKVMYKYLKSR